VDAYEQVQDDNRFDTVRLSKISALYQQVRGQQGKKPKRKKPSIKIVQRSDQLAYFRSALEECDHKKMECLKFWSGWTSDGRFFSIHDRVPITDSASNNTLKDVFSNKTCRVSIPIIPTIQTANDYYFWPLMRDIGLLTEYTDDDDERNFAEFSLSLLEFDWFDKKIQKVQTLSFEDQHRRFKFQLIIVDSMDPKRFLLRNRHADDSTTLKLGRVHNSELLFGDEILTMNRNIGLGYFSLVGNTLYSFNPWSFVHLDEPHMFMTQLGQEEQTSRIKLSPLPDEFTTVDGERYIIGYFAMERLYLAVQHKETKKYGIVWTSHETRMWESVNFSIDKPITSIEFIIDGHILLVQTNDYETEITFDVHHVQSTFYRIPLKKPEKLSILAWARLVHSKIKFKDPYEEARKYLPYNSNIRCPFEE